MSAPDNGAHVTKIRNVLTSDLLTHWPLVRCAVSDQLDVPTHIMPHLVPEDHHDVVIRILMMNDTDL